MAANTSFKVQCPSCEAMVPIRDPNLIGKKIDCPKCKYRFVVEDPGTADEEADDRPARKGAAGRKPGARPKPKKKAGSNNMVILGAVLGVVAIAVLGVGAWMLWPSGDSKPSTSSTKAGGGGSVAGSNSPPPTPPSIAGGPPGDVQPGGEGNVTPPTTDPAVPPTATPAVSRSPAGDITNLLPNDAQSVLSIHLDKLRSSTLGQQAFESRVGFKPETFKLKFGLGVEELTRMVRAENLDQGWTFNVLRASRPVTLSEFQGPLGLTKGPKSPIQGREYYTIAPNDLLDHLSTILQSEVESKESATPPKAAKAPTGPLAFLMLDATTLVVASQDPLEEFLQNGGKFPAQSQVTPSSGGGDQPADRGGGPGGDAAGGAGPGSPGLNERPPPGIDGGAGPQPARGGRGNRGGRGQGGGTQFTSRGTFLTIEPNLKAMLDHLEGDGRQVILTLAQRLQSNAKIVERVRDATGFKQLEVAGMEILGIALHQLDSDKVKGEVGVQFFREATARGFEEELRKVLPVAANAIGLYLGGLRIQTQGGPGDTTGTGTGGIPGQPGLGEMAPPSGGPAGSRGETGPPGGAPTGQMPGQPFGQPGEGQPGQNQGPRSTMGLNRQGRAIYFTMDLAMTERAYDQIYTLSESAVVRMKGMIDMADGQPRWDELAGVGVAMRTKDSGYPRGTFPRDEGLNTRLPRTWPPSQRVGWMVNLLPYLGQDELFQRIEKKKSWRDEENLKQGAVLIPQFLNPRYPRPSWRAAVPGLGVRDQGATHFVGVAGVGIDAADYPANDPRYTKKLGIFGYDRRTTAAEITDGLGNTMYMLQVPPTHQRPWIAGGGATVTGIPETGSVKPFVTTQADGRRGTYALMADGSVRFISESIADEVFKAMATTKGGEMVDDLDQKAPKVDPPKANMKATQGGAGSGGGN